MNTKKRFGLLTLVLVIVLVFSLALAACNPKTPPEPDPKPPTPEVKYQDVLNMIIQGVQKQASGSNINAVFDSSLDITVDDKTESFEVLSNITLDLAGDKDTADTYLGFEIKHNDKGVISLYYKDSNSDRPNIYVNVGEDSFAIKAASLKDNLSNFLAPDEEDLMDLDGAIDAIKNPKLSSILKLVVMGIFDNAKLSEDETSASVDVNLFNLVDVLDVASGFLPDDIDNILQDMGIDATMEDVLKTISFASKMTLEASFDSEGCITSLDLRKADDEKDLGEIIGAEIPEITEISYSVSELSIDINNESFSIPSSVLEADYIETNLLNTDIKATVSLPYHDGEEWINEGRVYELSAKINIDPFVLLNCSDLDEALKSLGYIHVKATEYNTNNVYFELVFDPENSGELNLFGAIKLQTTMAGLAGIQGLHFDLGALVEFS